MASSPKQLAERYLLRLRDASDPSVEIENIAFEIKKLTYENGNTISKETRLSIADLMEWSLPPSKVTSGGSVGILKESDNKKYLDLVKSLKGLLG